MRLLNDKVYNLQGVGNPMFGNVIIIPNVDYKAYRRKRLELGEYVKEIISTILPTGELSDVYITPLVHCKANRTYPVNNSILRNCSQILQYEFKKYNFKRVLILGSAVEQIMGLDLKKYAGKTIYYRQNNSFWTMTYSPLCKHSNATKYSEFKNHLTKWYNNVINKNNQYDYII